MALTRQWFALGIFVLQFIATFVAGQSGAIGGGSNKDVSDKNRVLFTPPGPAFSIWGIIFACLSVTAIWQIVSVQGRQWAADDKIFTGWIIMNVAQAAWAFSFPFEQMVAASFFIFVDWLGLLLISHRTMEIFVALWPSSLSSAEGDGVVQQPLLSKVGGRTGASSSSSSPSIEVGPKAAIRWWIFAQLGVGLQLGWLTAATSIQWTIAATTRESATDLSVQVACVAVAGALLATTAFWRSVLIPDISVAMAVVWALTWITQREPLLPVRVGNNSTVIPPQAVADGVTLGARVLAAGIGALVLAVLAVRVLLVVMRKEAAVQ